MPKSPAAAPQRPIMHVKSDPRAAMPRWLARMLRDWHGRKAQRLTAAAEKQRNKLDELTEKAAHHIHRAKHWDLISNRRHR